MGAQESKESEAKNILKVANLNFSGQQSSPFQYFSLEHLLEEQELNHIFSQVMKIAEQQMDKKQLFNEQTMKRISQIDKVIKLQRYSPLYNKNCGIIQGKFADREQFKKEWMKTLKETYGWKKLKKKVKEEKKANIVQNQMRQEKKKQAVPAKKNQKKPLPTVKETNEKQEIRIENEKGANKEKAEKEQKQAQFYGNDEYEQCIADYKEDLDRLRAFDYLVYASILRYVYEHPEMDTIIKDRACNKYRGFMESFFSKTYLNNNKKIIETIDFIVRNDVDVLFVQQATEKLCNELQKRDPDYRIIMSKQRPNDPGLSVIIFKQSSFKKSNIGRKGNLKLLQIAEDKKLREDVKKNFLSWGKCSFISIDNFILISCHSKSFTSQMQNDLKIIRQKFPGKYVIVGGTLSKGCKRYDSGDSDNTKGQYDMYPSGLATCYKKRTFMQFQRKKAGQLIKTQTNFLLYDRRLNLTNADDYINSKEDIYKGVFTIKNTLVEIQAVDDSKKKNILNGNKNQKNNQGEVDLVNIELLPSQQHPFDQLIVLTTLKIPPRIKKNARKGGKNLTKQEKDRLQFQTSSSEQEEKNEYRPGN